MRSRPLSVSSYSQRDGDVGRLMMIPSCSSLTSRADSVRGLISPVRSCSWQKRTVGSDTKNRSRRGVHLSPIISVAASTDPISEFILVLYVVKRASSKSADPVYWDYMKNTVKRFDESITAWVAATFGQSARPFFEFMTMLGDPLSVALVTVGVIASGIYASNVRLALSGVVIPVTVLVGAILKMTFERARPLTEYAMNMKLQTFSFPSGHSSGSMIAYGLLAYIAYVKLPAPWNYVATALLAVVPILVGISRVYLGAHFPSDVIAGWLLGLAALCVIIFFIRPFA